MGIEELAAAKPTQNAIVRKKGYDDVEFSDCDESKKDRSKMRDGEKKEVKDADKRVPEKVRDAEKKEAKREPEKARDAEKKEARDAEISKDEAPTQKTEISQIPPQLKSAPTQKSTNSKTPKKNGGKNVVKKKKAGGCCSIS